MSDPHNEMDDLVESVYSRRVWGNFVAGLALLLLVLCLSTAPGAPSPHEASIFVRIATLATMAGLALDDPPAV